MIYDIIIIGADAAGLTAGIYAGRKKMNALILTKQVGGQTFYSSNIENYPGFSSIFGIELISKMRSQVEKFGVTIKEDSEVVSVEKEDDGFSVLANGKEYRAKSVLIASGKRQRPLGDKGEEEFLGKGVSVCAICDAPFYKNKDVAEAGGGAGRVKRRVGERESGGVGVWGCGGVEVWANGKWQTPAPPAHISSGSLPHPGHGRRDRERDRDIICPCAYREADVCEFGSCYCNLYVSPAWNEGKMPAVYVPERRPREKLSFL